MRVIDLEIQLPEVRFAEDRGDKLHDDVTGQGLDEGREGGADDEPQGEVQHVAAIAKPLTRARASHGRHSDRPGRSR
jgi:hypothetical protein